MKKRLSDIFCVFEIHLARLRHESGPFLMAAIVFPIGMYLFASGIAANNHEVADNSEELRFLAASIAFSLSATAIGWIGYLLLENRFTGRLKLFATLPIAPSSYVFGILIFGVAQSAIGTTVLLIGARVLGVQPNLGGAAGFVLLATVVLLALLSLCGIGVVIAARVRSFSAGSLMTDALGAGMVLFAPVYYPPETLPVALRFVSQLLPTTYIARAINKILIGDRGIGAELLILSVMAIITLSLGFWQMNWREN